MGSDEQSDRASGVNMKFGVFTMNAHSCSEPDTAIAVATAAEQVGFDSLWCGEHVVMPEPASGGEPLGPRDPILDPVVALAHLAGATTTIRLATGVVILPLRNPLVLAKQLSSLDVLSKGRLMFGFGVGWLEEEFEALDVPFAERGAMADEYLETMITLWTHDAPSFHGKYHAFDAMQCRPQPVQTPYPHIVVGGSSKPAMRRTARVGNGWFSGLLFDDTTIAAQIRELNEISEATERPPERGPIEVTASVKGDLDLTRIEHLEAIGVSRLMLLPRPGVAGEGLVRWIEETAVRLGDVMTT